MASRCSDFLSLEERRSETSIAMKQKIQRLSPNKDCCHKLSCECDTEGEEEAAAAAAVQEDRHDNDSAGGCLEGGLAGSRTFKRTRTTTIEPLCHASIVVREHGSFLRNPRRSTRGFHSESRAVTELLLGGLLWSSRSSCTRHGTKTTTTKKKKKKQMRTRQDFWNCTLVCNLFLIPSLVSSPSRRWNSCCLPSATVAPSCSWVQCFFFLSSSSFSLISLPLELQPVFASSNASSMQPANAKSEDMNVKLCILRERFPQGCECTLSFVVIPSKCCCGDFF